MAKADKRASVMTHISKASDIDATKKDLWSSMLDGVASGKRLPEKNVLILGGDEESQKEFLESLSNDSQGGRKPLDRHASRPPPVANQFALGYTYHDVLDADHEDILARLSLYLLAEPSAAFIPLLRPLLTPQALPNTLIVILLNWAQPWSWVRQLRRWIRFLRALLVSLPNDSKQVMEETMLDWRDRGRGRGSNDFEGVSSAGTGTRGEVTLPLGPGEWDEAIGIPLCVVCQNAERIDVLERERGWKEEEFDFILQFLRTILLKHGASLVYTSASAPGALATLVQSSLGIRSLLKRHPLKHNIIDRDKILIPSNWDSWGKIRVLREGFDVEGVHSGWSSDIDGPPIPIRKVLGERDVNGSEHEEEGASNNGSTSNASSAVTMYEETIIHPKKDVSAAPSIKLKDPEAIETESMDTQEFLASQLEVLEQIRGEEDVIGTTKKGKPKASESLLSSSEDDDRDSDGITGGEDMGRVNEHIGPVQFNMGGIQVDADDMLKRIKDREANRTPDRELVTSSVESPPGKSQNEALASFFAGLIKRGSKDSPRAPTS